MSMMKPRGDTGPSAKATWLLLERTQVSLTPYSALATAFFRIWVGNLWRVWLTSLRQGQCLRSAGSVGGGSHSRGLVWSSLASQARSSPVSPQGGSGGWAGSTCRNSGPGPASLPPPHKGQILKWSVFIMPTENKKIPQV